MNIEEKANLLFNNVSGWETKTLERIGKRIKKYGRLSLADIKSINNISVVKGDLDLIIKDLAKTTGYNISQLKNMYGELLESQHLENKPLYDYRGVKFVPYSENKSVQSIVNAFARTTGNTMINLSSVTAQNLGFLNKSGKFVPIQKMYTDALDKAVVAISSGATDFHSAMRDTIIEMGGSGIRVNYGSGITRRLDTVVRQAMLYGAKQCSIEYNEMIGQELGCDGYEVDYHSNPRPSHEFMQGKQFVVGKSRTINGIHFDSFDEAEQALKEYGCLHYKTPIICGISEPRYSEKELARLKEQDKKTYEIDGKQVTGYEATQMQRRLETAVRNEKSIKNMAQAEGNKKLVSDCNAKIKAYQGKYDDISNITGIQGDKKRMSVPRGTATVKGATPTKVETPKKVFPKATSIEEAEKYASENLFTGYLGAKTSYKGIDLDIANGINEALENVTSKYGRKLSGIEVVNPKTAKGLKALGDANAPFATQSITGKVFINKDILKDAKSLKSYKEAGEKAFKTVIANKDKLSTSGRALAETYEKAGKSLVDDSLEGMITHEYGHFLNVELNPSRDVVEQIKSGMSSHTISGYSQHSVSEYLAECFVEFERGDVSKLDDVVIKLFNGAIK